MDNSISSPQTAHRVSPRLAISLVGISGWVLAILSEFLPAPGRVAGLAILAVALAVIAWLLESRNTRVGRWFTVVMLAVLVLLAARWLRLEGALAWMAIPAGLAAALISLRAAAATAVGETIVLLLLITVMPEAAATGLGWSAVGVALGAIWATLGLMVAAYHPVYQAIGQSEAYFERARGVLEEARDRRARMEQVMRDLTSANRQLALANDRMAALRLIAEEARKAKTMFVAKVSHEFRTPLNMIIGLVALMVETPEIYNVALPPDMRQDLEVVHRNCRHLANMIDDVLNLTQMDAGRLTLHREWVKLEAVIDNAVESVRPLAQKKSLFLRTQIPPGLPGVYCDRTRVQQVVLNLVSNAARFTERGGITIRAECTDKHVVVSVADTGPGIAPEDAERVFEPFCQGSTDLWRDKGGSGLGLSISKQFVQLHGGRMWFENEAGPGTTFFFELPISAPIQPLPRPGHQIRADWIWREHAFRTERAGVAEQLERPRLLVYDETGGLSSELTSYSEQIELVEARDLAQTVHALEQCPAQALLLNASSPDAVWPLVERARAGVPDTPIVGCSVPPRIESTVKTGAQSYLIKPVTRDGLLGAIQASGKPVKRILIVDDDADVLRLFTRMLRLCDSDLAITTASSGEEALNAIRASSPDLVLLDLVMPGMDGWQVLERLRRHSQTAELPVVLVTAQDLVERPPESKLLVTSVGSGIGVSRLLLCSLALSEFLLAPEGTLAPVPG